MAQLFVWTVEFLMKNKTLLSSFQYMHCNLQWACVSSVYQAPLFIMATPLSILLLKLMADLIRLVIKGQ